MQQLQNHKSEKYITFPFIKEGKELTSVDSTNTIPQCGLTVKNAGSMRFRWAEQNKRRDLQLAEISRDFGKKTFVPVELNHTKIVYDIHNAQDTLNKIGDGLITKNQALIPTVTVADCLPIYLYDPQSQVFGIVHSGWKGTGIICSALDLACKNYGSKIENFCIVIGPHIHSCCYIVNQERAEYFAQNFTPDCVKEVEKEVFCDWNTGGGKLYSLSLSKANLAILKKVGVKEDNIFIHPDCTSCSKNGFYGSNRRETKEAGRPDSFTVQAAFIAFK